MLIEIRRKLRGIVWLFFLVYGGVMGCTSKDSLFYWGDYEDSLYQRYANEDAAKAEKLLKKTILTAEEDKTRVPPGVCADYGFLLYRRGDQAGAVKYFEKEKQAYPESATLMAKLIDRIKQPQLSSNTPKGRGPETKGTVLP